MKKIILIRNNRFSGTNAAMTMDSHSQMPYCNLDLIYKYHNGILYIQTEKKKIRWRMRTETQGRFLEERATQ